MIVAALAVIIFAVLVTGIFASIYFPRRSAAPFWPTPISAIREALREADLRRGEVFYDLGAGTGRTLLIAEREFGARAVGCELSIPFYLIGCINLFIRSSHSRLIFKNLFTQDLADADVVFCFLAIRTMPRIEEKIRRELKPGARIVVYAFPLPGMKPEKIIRVHGEWKMFIYRA